MVDIGIFRTESGPDWPTYLACLKQLDREWRAKPEHFPLAHFGVFGPRPSWQDTIARAQILFDSADWTTLAEDQLALIAPTSGADALLGSIGRRSPDIRSLLFDPDREDDRNFVLNRLKWARSADSDWLALHAGKLLVELCSVQGMGKAFATRLLALARPEWFVVVNNKSRQWLMEATGLRLSGKKRSYRNLITWVANQAWHASPAPADHWELSIWQIRAALLDAFAYQPHS